MALLTLLLLTSLSMAFAMLAQMEPTIAGNHLRASQAHAMAESGIERAVWALSNATTLGGFGGTGSPPNVTVSAIPTAPHDGSTFVPLDPIGGFRLSIVGTDPNLRTVRSLGWASRADERRGIPGRQIAATLTRVRNVAFEAPCVLCVRSALVIEASAIDARSSQGSSCGSKVAVASGGAVTVGDSTELGGEITADQASFDFLLSADDLDTLKALAALGGTYVSGPRNVRLDLGTIPHGLVFVDTSDATNAITPANAVRVTLTRGPAAPFRGWIVVNGDVAFEPDFGGIDGLIYAANTLAASDTGGSRISGIVIAKQALGQDSLTVRGLVLTFDCAAARGGGLLPDGWFVKPGSYCDGTTGC